MQKIVPHLWFATQAKEATQFYTTLFPNSKVTHVSTISGTPSGECDIVSFILNGMSFMAISAGPVFTLNPSISLMVNFDPSIDKDARKHLDEVWTKLSQDGKVLMPLDTYPFSEHYGWIQDKYGLSWQLILTKPEGEPRPPIIPSVMFIGANAGKAEEATNFYLSLFTPSKRGIVARYPDGMLPDKKDTLMFTDFSLNNQWFAAMDSAHNHKFALNEAFSFIIRCETQDEIDYYWEKLSAVPAAEQCGWLKDKYGLSWQIVPTIMDEMMSKGTKEQTARVTQAFLQMKKFDIAKLQQAYNQ